MVTLPEFESADLVAFGQAFLARSKALKRRFVDVAVSRDSNLGGDHREVAEVTFRKLRSPKSTTIRLVVWPDRWVWVDAREMGPSGWKWSFNAEGRISGEKSWADLIRNVEEMDVVFSSSESAAKIERASAMWNGVLLKGPTGAVSRVANR